MKSRNRTMGRGLCTRSLCAAASLIVILILIFPLSAQTRNDVVVMKNGDRLTCEIVSLNDGVLSVKLDYADGTVSLQWSNVARVEGKRLFIVKTEKGMVYTGTLGTVDTPGDKEVTIEVAKTPDTKVALPSNDVVTIGTTADRFLQRFNGDINIGMSYAKGNQSTQYNLNSSIEYPRDRWRAEATFSSNLSSTAGVKSSTRNSFAFRADRLLRWNNYFYTGGLSLLQSSEQGIKLQTNFNGGVGYYLRHSSRIKISVMGGLGWQRTDYVGTGTSRSTQNTAAAIISTDLRFFRFKKTTLNLDATLLPSISEPGRIYFKLRQSYYVKLFSNLSWNISFYGNWDNRPPAGLSGSDYGTSTGLGWTFGNK